MYARQLSFFGFLALLLSCTEKEPEPLKYHIDDELMPYLETFLTEADDRGLGFEADNLIMEFGEPGKELCGECHFASNGQRTITIAKNSICWVDAHTLTREALILHELGHCLLLRSHRDDEFDNGDPVSIMHSQNDGPYSPCSYDIGGDNECNKTPRRTYYINELFDPETPAPDWGG